MVHYKLLGEIEMIKKALVIILCIAVLSTIGISAQSIDNETIKEDTIVFDKFIVFGLSVDVKILQLEPGEDYSDIEILDKPLYIWENGLLSAPEIRNPGEFIRLYVARGIFLPSLPFCIGICDDWSIIG